jgi:hypothetical protein
MGRSLESCSVPGNDAVLIGTRPGGHQNQSIFFLADCRCLMAQASSNRNQHLPKIFPGVIFDLRGAKNGEAVERRHYDGFFVHTAFMRVQQPSPLNKKLPEQQIKAIRAVKATDSTGNSSMPLRSIATNDAKDSNKYLNAVENKMQPMVANRLAQLSRVSFLQNSRHHNSRPLHLYQIASILCAHRRQFNIDNKR